MGNERQIKPKTENPKIELIFRLLILKIRNIEVNKAAIEKNVHNFVANEYERNFKGNKISKAKGGYKKSIFALVYGLAPSVNNVNPL